MKSKNFYWHTQEETRVTIGKCIHKNKRSAIYNFCTYKENSYSKANLAVFLFSMNYLKIFQEIINDNTYLCLATADKNGTPWASPLLCITDEHYHFYFISADEALHSKNIRENNRVALSIYNSCQTIGSAFGVQASWHASCVSEEALDVFIKKTLYERTSLVVLSREFSFYKIILDEVYLPDESRWKETGHIRTKLEIPRLS